MATMATVMATGTAMSRLNRLSFPELLISSSRPASVSHASPIAPSRSRGLRPAPGPDQLRCPPRA